MAGKMVKISGMWWRESKRDGRRFLSGKCGNTSILIFETDKSKSRDPSKAPDYELVLAPIDDSLPLTPLPMPEAEAARAQGYGAKGAYRPQSEPPPGFDDNEPPPF